ncbi:MAG TPA: methyl-accepting chemotaxis protein [Bryobacteraceae bacterium]|nr:methyl-accepting chemotaxis protein [Bryobacteraceae bacterium]
MKTTLGYFLYAILLAASAAGILLKPSLQVILAAAFACYGGLAFGCFRARHCGWQLRNVSGEFSETVEQVADAARQLASASQSLAQSVSLESESLSAATGAGELMASITRQSADAGRTTAGLAGEAQQLANRCAEGLESLAGTLRESNAAAGKIGKVTKVVDEIAFQTNILALNAAVEAARAGQSGAGFAIVADEVRNLAQRSAEASQEIAGLAQESIARARAGESEMEQLSGAIRSLIGHSSQVKELVDEIAANCHELALGTESVVREMQQVEELSRCTSTSSGQTAASSQHLSTQAEAMRRLIGSLARIAL